MKDHTPKHTPVVRCGSMWLKRDDHYRIAGICGGKVRACWHLATRQRYAGLITASARQSPQAQIVARLAAKLGIPARLHMPTGAHTPEMRDVLAHGGEIIQHKAGYNNVLICRANYDCDQRPGWCPIPFGMDHPAAMQCTRGEVKSLAPYRKVVRRVVVPVGSGMTLAGVLWGLDDLNWTPPVLGVVVGADPTKRLDHHAPPFWRQRHGLRLVPAGVPYHTHVAADIGGVGLDPVYEAKCVPYLRDGDLFWIVGKRCV